MNQQFIPWPSRSALLWSLAGFFAVTLLIYGVAVLSNHFVLWDDNYLIYFNPHIKSLSLSNIVYNFTHFDPELYVPFTMLSYQLDAFIGGINAPMFHFTNLVFHTLNASFVALMFYFLLGRQWIAILLGLLFAVHPLNTEAVMWASARKDVLSMFFFLASIIAYLRYRSTESKKIYWISLALFLCGLLSKVLIATLPAVLLLIDVWQRRKIDKWMIVDKIPYFLLSAIFITVALFAKKSILEESSLWEKLLMAGKSTVFYIEKFFVPAKLSLMYPYLKPITITSIDFWLPLLLVCALAVAALLSLKKTRVFFVGIGIFLVTLLPTFTNFSKGGFVYFASDRYVYIGMLGIMLILGWVLLQLEERSRSPRRFQAMVTYGSAAILCVLGLLAYRQAETWRDSETLFTHTIGLYPDASPARVNLAVHYREIDRLDLAKQQLEKALVTFPHVRTYTGLATIEEGLGNRAKAYEYFQKAIQMDPKDPEGYFGIGILKRKEGKLDEAIQYYREALKRDPNYVGIYNNLGELYLQREDYVKAEEAYRKSAEIDPYFPDAQYNLGVIAEDKGNIEEAIARFERTVELDKEASDAYAHLATLYLGQRRVDDSIDAVKRTLAIDPLNDDALFLQEQLKSHGLWK